jgi:hypothetical protein
MCAVRLVSDCWWAGSEGKEACAVAGAAMVDYIVWPRGQTVLVECSRCRASWASFKTPEVVVWTQETVVRPGKRRRRKRTVPRAFLSTLALVVGLSEWTTEQGENEGGLVGNTSSTE